MPITSAGLQKISLTPASASVLKRDDVHTAGAPGSVGWCWASRMRGWGPYVPPDLLKGFAELGSADRDRDGPPSATRSRCLGIE